MTQSLDQNVVLRSMAPLLSAESADEFASLRKELKNEIQPEGAIEQIYVDDFATLIWEILRLRRYKTVILNSSRRAALQGILEQLLSDRDYEHSYQKDIDAEDLARSWFDNKNAQARVAKLLRKFQMDEGAIEAEAFRLCSEELERLERILTALEFRRDRALRFIAEYRQLLSKQLRQAGDRILEHDDVPRLVAVAKRSE
jgi:type IV secretory pathway VirB4 component